MRTVPVFFQGPTLCFLGVAPQKQLPFSSALAVRQTQHQYLGSEQSSWSYNVPDAQQAAAARRLPSLLFFVVRLVSALPNQAAPFRADLDIQWAFAIGLRQTISTDH